MYDKLTGAAGPTGALFVKRLREVMAGKYNIRDKFVVVASALDEIGADQDIESFKQIKDVRDGLHDMRFLSSELPVDVTQNLLRKYLRLHLSATV
jgi:hypothetical protein